MVLISRSLRINFAQFQQLCLTENGYELGQKAKICNLVSTKAQLGRIWMLLWVRNTPEAIRSVATES